MSEYIIEKNVICYHPSDEEYHCSECCTKLGCVVHAKLHELEQWEDENGTVWTPPTAYAYAMVCKARDRIAEDFVENDKQRELIGEAFLSQEKRADELDAELEIERSGKEKTIAERDEAREFAEEAARLYNDLLEQVVLRCAFCEAEYPEGTPATQHANLAEHVKVCPKHPMRKVERERDELRKDLNALARSMSGLH